MGKTIAVDLDGTLAQYDGWRGRAVIGDPLPGAVEAMKTLAKAGYEIIVFTCRCNPENDADFSGEITCEQAAQLIREWLDEHQFPVAMDVWEGHGKPFAEAYLDDRAYRVEPQVDADAWGRVLDAMGVTK